MQTTTKWFLLAALCATTSWAWADEQATDNSSAITSLLNGQSVGIVRFDLPRIDFSALEKQVLQPLCQSETDRIQLSTAMAQCREWQQRLQKEGARQVYFITTLENSSAFSDLRYPEQVIVSRTIVVLPGAKAGTLQEIIDSVQGTRKNPQAPVPPNWVVCHEMGGSTVIACAGLMDKLQSLKPAPRPELEQALAAAGDQPFSVALAPPPIFALAAAQIFAAPAPGSTQPLGQIVGSGIRWISLGLDPSAQHFHAAAIVKSADAAAATSLAQLLHSQATQFGKSLIELNQDFPLDTEATLQSLVPKVENDRLVLSLDEKQAAGLRTFGQKAYAAAMASTYRRQSVNNLKEISLGILNYEDKNHQLPDRAIRDKNGKPLLSWRVAILPWIEEKSLYNEFHLDEPWDSDHNRKLIERMPEAYRNPDSWRQHPGRTRYLAPVGEDLYFPPDRPITIKEVTDGTSKTIMVVEADADHAVIWTKPDDLEIDLDNPAHGLAAGNRLFSAAFGDGHVEGILGSVKSKTLRALFTRNGGEPTPQIDEQ